MSEIKNRKNHMKIGSFKLNRISLINQSGFNFLLKKIYLNQKNLEELKEIMMNNKNKEKPFDIYFTPVQSINSNIKKKEIKSNPLLERNKIIKKHNILKNLNFNSNIFKINSHKKNDNNLTLYNRNITLGKKMNSELSLNLPLLSNTKRENNNSSKKVNKINLYKNINTSISYNNFQPNISSPSIKIFNDIKKNNLFTNEKIKTKCSDIPKKIKANYTDKEIQTNLDFDYSINKEKENNDKKSQNSYYINLNAKKKKFKINENLDESSSNEFDDIKEIEKIISKSSLNIHQNLNKNNYKKTNYDNFNKNNYISVLNKSDYEIQKDNNNKNDYILLNSLYKVKNYKNENNENKHLQNFNQSQIDRRNYMKTEFIINKKLINEKKNHFCMNKNLFNRSNMSKENNKLNGKKRIKELNELIPYNDRKKIKKKKLNDLYNLLY